MNVEIKMTGQAITAQYGTLSTGDILRCSKEFADHLVNDCKCAEYVKVEEEKETIKAAKPKKEG